LASDGWISIHRQIWNNWTWQDKPFSKGQAWIDLLLLVNHEDNKIFIDGELMLVKRGQRVTSIRQLADRWGWSRHKVDDFLKYSDKELDVITLFYPFVTRHHLLLWGLPLQFFLPERIISHAAKITKKNSAFIVYCHTVKEHEIFVSLTKKSGAFMLLREGPVQSNLVDFYEAVEERRFSIWKKN